MSRTVPAASQGLEINEWSPVHETPTLLYFTGRVPTGSGNMVTKQELSRMLTRKFREYFP